MTDSEIYQLIQMSSQSFPTLTEKDINISIIDSIWDKKSQTRIIDEEVCRTMTMTEFVNSFIFMKEDEDDNYDD